MSCLLFIAVLLAGLAAVAVENIEITGDKVKVYEKSDIASKVIGILPKGAIVPAATNPVGNFRKVLIVVQGVKKIGFINTYDLKGGVKVVRPTAPPPSPMPGQNQGQTRPAPQATRTYTRPVIKAPYQGLHRKYALGVHGGLNYQYQGGRAYPDGTGGTVNVGTLTGAMGVYGASVTIPFNWVSALDLYMEYKPISVTGTATPSGGTASSTIVLAQTYLSAGAFYRMYSSMTSTFWYGVGFQIDHANSGSLQIGNSAPLPSQQGDLPNLMMFLGGAGVDFGITRSLFFVPELRVGVLWNTSPWIYEVDADVGLKYAF